MKVSPLLPSHDLSHPSHSSHSSNPPPKYAWSVFYPMQAFSEKVEKKENKNNENNENKNDENDTVENDKNKNIFFNLYKLR